MVNNYARRRRLRRRLSGFDLKNVFVLNKLVKYIFFAVVAGILAVPVLFLWYSRDLPTPGTLVQTQFENATRIYDRNGELLYSVFEEENRSYVSLQQIAKPIQQATIAIEDEDFYKNKGFSPLGYLRIIPNLFRFGRVTGASTITQQLVKNVLLSDERSLPRKVKELILSIQVNSRFSKDEILEMYLNNIPYGGTAVGVEAASQQYFGKKAAELTLAEAAFLAGLPQSPSTYSPFSGNKYYIGRAEQVLRQMVDNKYITRDQSKKALEDIKKMKFSQRETALKAPHFVMYIRQKLAEEFGDAMVNTGGLQVTTTLDYKLQKEAEAIMKDEIDKLEAYNAGNGAGLISNPKTGEILAMVGSKDYYDEENEGNFNAVFANRQPGSSLKPIIYAKAFEKGYTPATMLMDVKTEFTTGESGDEPYSPVNYSGKFQGPVQVRFALGNSLNIPAVKMLAMVGIEDAMQKAYEMGISNWEPTDAAMRNVGLSLVLGGRETTLHDEVTAYGVFANKGIKQDLYGIQMVKDSKGKKLFEHKKTKGDQALSEEIAFLISHVLLDNVARTQEFGSNSLLRIPGKTAAVKTGTTDQKRDNWAVGYTPSVVVGVWVGNNDNSAMNPRIASGVTGASPIWNKLMQAALKEKKNEEFPKPDDVIAMQIDPFAGGLPIDGQPTRTEYFIKGTEPTSKSQIYQNKDGKDYWVFKESDPFSTDGKNRWQEGIDKWIEQFHKGEERYNPPNEVKNPDKSDPTPTPTTDPNQTPSPTPTSEQTPTPTPDE
jgi:penicillin-binding protein 1C